MKKIICAAIILFASVCVFAIDYQKVVCPVCQGYKMVWSGFYDVYGQPTYCCCGNCGGAGFILVPYNNNVTFEGAYRVNIYGIDGNVVGQGTFSTSTQTVSFMNVNWSLCSSNSSHFEYQLCGKSGKRNFFSIPDRLITT